jgi:hypothetical protein
LGAVTLRPAQGDVERFASEVSALLLLDCSPFDRLRVTLFSRARRGSGAEFFFQQFLR